MTIAQIAKNIGIQPSTLSEWNKKYPDIHNALKVGHEFANFRVENKLYEKALSGHVGAMIFWLKNNWRNKYRETWQSSDEEELTKAQARKMMAEAEMAEQQARELSDTSTFGSQIVFAEPLKPKEDKDNGKGQDS